MIELIWVLMIGHIDNSGFVVQEERFTEVFANLEDCTFSATNDIKLNEKFKYLEKKYGDVEIITWCKATSATPR